MESALWKVVPPPGFTCSPQSRVSKKDGKMIILRPISKIFKVMINEDLSVDHMIFPSTECLTSETGWVRVSKGPSLTGQRWFRFSTTKSNDYCEMSSTALWRIYGSQVILSNCECYMLNITYAVLPKCVLDRLSRVEGAACVWAMIIPDISASALLSIPASRIKIASMPKNEVLCSNGDVLWVDVEVASHQQCGPSFRVPIKVSSDSPEFVAKFNLIKLMDNFDENSDYSSVTKGKFSQSPMSDCYTVGFLPPNVGLINFAQQTSEQSIVILDEIRNYLQKKSLSNRVFTVSGRSGAGKSRLIIEACRRVGLSVTRCHRPLNPKEFKSSVLILKVDSLMDEDDLFYREVREYVDMDGRGTCLFIVHPLETTESTVHIRMYKLVTFSWKIDSFIFAGEENFQKLCSDKRIHGGSFSVRWGDIGGLEEAKKMLIESLDFASINFSKIGYKKKEFFPRNNLDSGEVEACLDQLSELQIVQSHGFQKTYQESQKFGQKKQSKLGRRCGVLLHGPPGTGKTMLAQGFSELVGCSFLPVKGPELLNMYVGESEARVRETFLKAREMQPCIIFFDEIDSLAASRGGRAGDFSDRLVSQLAIELDRIAFDESIEVFVIGATNRADLIDPVLLRPGRLEKLVYLAAPETSEQQAEILKMTANRFDRQATVKADRFAKIDWYEVSRRLVKSVSPADLANIVNCSMKLALKRYLNRGSVVSGDVIIVEPFDVEHVISPFISK